MSTYFTASVTILGYILLSTASVVSSLSNEQTSTNARCESKCSCCLKSAQCSTQDGSCNDMCQDGYFGWKCKTNCPPKCIKCTVAPYVTYTGKCTECREGYYSTEEYYQCQFNCTPTCQTCTSASVCTSCKTGYVLHNGCINQCVGASGACTCKAGYTGSRCGSCADGWFLFEDKCIQCHSPCATCASSNSICTSCIKGYYQNGNICQQCTLGCDQCSSSTSCDLCMTGHYSSGSSCVKCSPGCLNSTCDVKAGSCSCKDGFVGEKCDHCAANYRHFPNCSECAQGYFGTMCNQNCPAKCRESVCLKQNGTCTQGCVGSFLGENCTDCVIGQFGPNCSEGCPENCQGSCNQTSGYCHTCKTFFSGNICDSCMIEKYGRHCNFSCPSGCKDSCDKENGNCHSCIDGRYGNICQNNCSEHCVNGTCELKNGACDHGCISSFSGGPCCLGGPNCKNCSRSLDCIDCEDGFYGINCSERCSPNCAGNICDRENGTCNSCISGYKGDSCELHFSISDGVGFPVPLVAGVVAVGVLIVIISCCIIILRRRSPNKAHRTDSDQLKVSFYTEGESENDVSTEEDINREPNITLPDGTVYAVARKPPRKTHNELSTVDATATTSDTDQQGTVYSVARKTTGKTLNKLPTVDSTATTSETDQQGNIAAAANSDYYNTYYDGNRGIAVNDLARFIERMNERGFNEEFQKLPKGLIKPTDEAEKLHNLKKNRYNAMYPYDDNRVVLDGPGSDFINASYIEGFRKRREYIASFGPVAKATEGFNTFWRMVWQEKTEKIVMVTNLRENGGMKCEKYWPDVNVTILYGDVSVTGHTEDVYAEYTVRSFTVKKGKEERSLHHIHYTAWPDKGVPDDVTSMIEFRSKVNATKVKLGGQIIVHCSAGVGRTGTYIALDILTLQGNRTGCVDIFDCVEKLRQQRTIMVQTLGQYEYVYRALVHSLTLGSEAIPAEKFRSYISSLSGEDMKIKFEKLTHLKEKISTEEHEAVTRNMALKRMSRVGADIPGDNNRPRLYVGRTAGESSFINAVFVNSFKVKKQFVVTQTPLPTTVKDFLTLVVQEKCSCIVSMDPVGLSDKTIGIYMPADNQVLRTELFEVRSAKVETNPSYTLRTLDITAHFKQTSTTHTVKHFQCSHWPEMSKTPKSTDHFLQLVNEVQSTAEASPGHSPVMVHCLTGSERSGLLCVVMSLIQKMEIEHEVSVINTVRQVKLRRPRAIPDMDQFSFCHHCVSQYLEAFDTYSNFI